MKFKNWFILIMLIFIMGFSCKKGDKPCLLYNHTIYVSKALNPFLFDVGSHWKYKSVQKSEYDNVEVTNFEYSSDIEYAVGPGGNCPDGTLFYFYNIYYSSSEFGESRVYTGFSMISIGLHYGGVLYLADCDIGYHRLNATVAEKYDTLVVNGMVFRDVVKMELDNDGVLKTDMNLYWADSIGIVRKEIKANGQIKETWDLESYNVVLHTH